jgi:hypothetical protein
MMYSRGCDPYAIPSDQNEQQGSLVGDQWLVGSENHWGTSSRRAAYSIISVLIILSFLFLQEPHNLMDRRAWLTLSIGALSGGCLGRTGPSKKQIAWIRVKNNRDEACDIEVFIERNGNEVLRENYKLGTDPEQATIQVDNPVTEPGRYSLYLDLGDQMVDIHPSEFADADIRTRCIGIEYVLHKQGTTGFEFESVREC